MRWRLRGGRMGDDGNPHKEVCVVGWTPQLQNVFSLMPEGHLTPPEP